MESLSLSEHNRLFDKVKLEPSGCWTWTAAKCRKGYARFGLKRGGKNITVGVHRLVFRVFRHEIADDIQVHHICGNRGCVNPGHLRAVTAQEHVDLEPHRYEPNRSKTHCKNGHEFSVENTRVYHDPSRGWVSRHCRTCERQWKADWKRRNRAKLAGAA